MDGAVTTRATAYYGGGTMGGDYLELRYDTDAGEYVLVTDSRYLMQQGSC